MKFRLFGPLLFLLGLCTATLSQTSAFTYQGKLTDGGSPANGTFDITFKLYDALANGTQIGADVEKDNVAVSDGIFTVSLDFGSSAFPGAARFLDISVRPGASTGAFTQLAPRQAITSSPYAIAAERAGFAARTATVTSGATPSVTGLTTLVLNYPSSSSITGLIGGVEGQCVTLVVGSQPMTVNTGSGTQFRLTGNWTGQVYDSLTVCLQTIGSDQVWVEKTRSVNAPFFNLTVGPGPYGYVWVGPDPALICEAPCYIQTRVGTRKMLTAVPWLGYEVAGWTGACAGTLGTDPCFVTVNGNTEIGAWFVPRLFDVTVVKTGTGNGTVNSSPNGINCGPICATTYPSNTQVTLAATPAINSIFSGWSGGGCSGTGTCITTITSNTLVTANFTVAPRQLTIAKSGNGSGRVTSFPSGIDCGADCVEYYDHGTFVQLTAIPDLGSTFADWGFCSGTEVCTIEMNQPRVLNAIFTLMQFQLEVVKTGNGAGHVASGPAGIDCGPTCSANFDFNTVVTLRAAPLSGSAFTGWSGPCSGTGDCVVTINQAQSATATFTLQ